MNEAEWLACIDPTPMLGLSFGKWSDRKSRLFAAAAFRHLDYLLTDHRHQQGIDLLEQMADGMVASETVRTVTRAVRLALPPPGDSFERADIDDPYYVALMLYRGLLRSPIDHANQALAGLAERNHQRRRQCGLIRDIFGNPFRPAILDTAWLRWRDGFIPQLAQSIYDERRFADLPILGDALEDAGCTNMDILDHCHRPAEHVRGCWVIDLLLGKD